MDSAPCIYVRLLGWGKAIWVELGDFDYTKLSKVRLLHFGLHFNHAAARLL